MWILGPFWRPSWLPKTAKLAQEASWSEVKSIFKGSWTVLKKHFKKNENFTPNKPPKSSLGGPDGAEPGQCKRTHFREKRQRRLHGNEILSFVWRWATIRECILHSLSPWRAASGGRPYIPPQSPRGLLRNNQKTRQMLQRSLGGSKGASPQTAEARWHSSKALPL